MEKENKKNGVNIVLTFVIVILLGVIGFLAYRLGEAGRKTIDDENLPKGGNTSVIVDIAEDEKEDSKDTKEETVVVPTELDTETQKILNEVVKNVQFIKFGDNSLIFNSLMDYLIRNNESTGFSTDPEKYGSIYRINKNNLTSALEFISKNSNVDEILNLQKDKDVNYYGYYIENGEEVITLIAGGHGDVSIKKELINKEVKNNQLVLTYKTSCWNSENWQNGSSVEIGNTTVFLDYINQKFYLNNIDVSNGTFTCEQT